MIVGPTHVQLSSSMMHRMELVLRLSFEDIIPRKGGYNVTPQDWFSLTRELES